MTELISKNIIIITGFQIVFLWIEYVEFHRETISSIRWNSRPSIAGGHLAIGTSPLASVTLSYKLKSTATLS